VISLFLAADFTGCGAVVNNECVEV